MPPRGEADAHSLYTGTPASGDEASIGARTSGANIPPLRRLGIFLIPPLAALGPWASFTPGAEGSPYFFRILLVLMLIPAIGGIRSGWPDMPPRARAATWAGAIFLLWGCIGLLWTPDFTSAQRNLISVALGMTSVVVMLGTTRGHPQAVSTIRWGLLAAVIATGAVGMWEIRTGSHLSEYSAGTYFFSPTSIAATFVNPNNFGAFLLGTVGPTLIVIARLRSILAQAAICILLAFTLFLALNTESRGALLGSLALILLAALALALFDLGYFITAALILTPIALTVPMFFASQFSSLVNSATTSADARSDELRIVLTEHAIRYFWESRGVGTGPGSFLTVLQTDPSRSAAFVVPPHNTLAQVAAEYGVIGLIAFLLILVACIRSAFPPAIAGPLRLLQFEMVLCFAALVYASLVASTVLGEPTWWVLIGYLLCLSWTFRVMSEGLSAQSSTTDVTDVRRGVL